MTILIADDSKSSRDALRFLIKKQCNAEIKEAANGIEALNIIKSDNIDVLITDIKMPQMDGIELIEQAKGFNDKIQVVVFSAFGNFEFAKKVLKYGAINYLLKPINAEEFSNTLLTVINTYKQKQQQYSLEEFEEITVPEFNKSGPLPYPLNNYNVLILLQSENNLECVILEKALRNYTEKYILKPYKSGFLVLIQYFGTLSDQAIESLLPSFPQEYECYIHYAGFEDDQLILHDIYIQTTEASKEDLFWERPFGYYSTKETKECHSCNNDIKPLFETAHKIGIHIAHCNENIDIDTEIEQFIKNIHDLSVSAIQCKYIFIDLIKTVLSNTSSDISYESAIEHITAAEYISDIRETIELITSNQTILHDPEHDGYASPLIKTALDIVRKEYMFDINRTTIANRIYVSSAYFSHLFKKETGKNFSQYLNEFRMNCARTMLRSSTQSIQSIAKSVGFTNYPYFCSQFKKLYGQTCNQYRESHFKEGD